MKKKLDPVPPYSVYKFGRKERIKGPNGLDLSLSCVCAGCVKLYMNIAYEAGLNSKIKCQSKKRLKV